MSALELEEPRRPRGVAQRGQQKQCRACGNFGHNARTCARRAAPEQLRVFDDSHPVPDAPVDLGPWQGCVAGDPFCPCVDGIGHVA